MFRMKNRKVQIEEVKISLKAPVPENHILRAIDFNFIYEKVEGYMFTMNISTVIFILEKTGNVLCFYCQKVQEKSPSYSFSYGLCLQAGVPTKAGKLPTDFFCVLTPFILFQILGDLKLEAAQGVAKIFENTGFETSAIAVDISSRESILKLVKHAQTFGAVKNFISAAGVSPSQASVEKILQVDLYGTAVLLEEFGKIISSGGSGVVVSSQSGHRLGALTEEQNFQLATTPTEELLNLPFLKAIIDTLKDYQYSKRCNVLRVAGQATAWGFRGATINSISPGIIITPLAADELKGPRGECYRKMLAALLAGRAGTPDEVGDLAQFLMSSRGRFISGRYGFGRAA